jgi:hypothetical protein
MFESIALNIMARTPQTPEQVINELMKGSADLLIGFMLVVFMWAIRVALVVYALYSWGFFVTKIKEIYQLFIAQRVREGEQIGPFSSVNSIFVHLGAPIMALLIVEIFAVAVISLQIISNPVLGEFLRPWG